MTVIERVKKLSRNRPKRIVFPEANDPRVIQAAIRLAEEKLATPILIQGEDEEIRGDNNPVNAGRDNNPVSADQNTHPIQLPHTVEIIRTSDPSFTKTCAQQLYENRKHRGLSSDAAALAITDRLLLGALLVKTGVADAGVAGSIATTASVIRSALYGIGTAPAKDLVSSFFLMQFPDRCWTYADCGVVPDPNASQLAQIAIDAATNHQRLTGQEPRVALLSFSTKGSADHPDVSKVRTATEIVQQSHSDWIVDGELQFDAAMIPDVAARKAPDSPLAGTANVFIFPDLTAGNIAYKITERLGGAAAIGPIIQGLSQPFMDLSRGCQVDDIVNVAMIAGLLSETSQPADN